MTAITLEGLGRTFAGGVRAVRPTGLSIGSGEVLALLGPSGCGKTTLLRMIAGLEAPDPGGRLLFDGQDVTAVPTERRGVGMVFQHYALFPNMSVAQNVAYGLRMQGAARAARAARVAEVLDLCEVGELADRPVTALSGGQRQRVALARAIAPSPRVILLDEPLSALDAGLRDRLRDELARLLRRVGITAVMVTHDQAEAMAIADRVAVMRAGSIAQVDTPRAVYGSPADAWVARFVGSAMVLDGRLERRATGARLHLPGGVLELGDVPEGARVLIRPKGFALTEPASAPLVGEVARALYLGDRLRIEICGATHRPLMVDAAPETVLAPGHRVGLIPHPGALLILKEPREDAE